MSGRRHRPYDSLALLRADPRRCALHTLSHTIQSMTGYAAASADSPRGRLTLELRSVNARFLDLQFRIAEELRTLEPALRELIGARVARGKVDCRSRSPSPAIARNATRLNAEALQRLALAGRCARRFPKPRRCASPTCCAGPA